MKKFGLVSILDRYLFMEMFYPIMYCVLGLTVIFISANLYELTDLLIDKHAPVLVVLQILIFRIPTVLAWVFPIAVLFATVYTLGRLVKDNEITSMRMAGYGLHRIIIPFLLLGLVVSFSAYWINEKVAPWTNHRAMNLIRQMMMQDVTPVIKEDTFFRGPDDRYFYVRTMDRSTGTFFDVMIYEAGFSGLRTPFPRVITARKGSFYKEMWELEDGVVHEFDEEGFIQSETKFAKMSVPVGDGLEHFFGNQKTAAEMSRTELVEELELFAKSGIKINSWEVEYHLKLAAPFVSFIFVLIGTPLSMHNRKGWGWGIVFTIVAVFGFYVLQSLTKSLGEAGKVDAMLSAWIPNIAFMFIGAVLLIREEFYLPRR